ncbi:hypothetical protein [Candidatus Korobacter versatilis]|uniref:hypothetical protein n=1 Tax=Candidatus Korobacter versatilis TaxID=658062 RepID=UPI0002FC53C8|nr:hypothetical protein [Candidatus Koribacter versatilis]
MKDTSSAIDKRPTRRTKRSAAASTNAQPREDADFMELDDWADEDDDFFDDFFPEEVKRR